MITGNTNTDSDLKERVRYATMGSQYSTLVVFNRWKSDDRASGLQQPSSRRRTG